MSEGGFTVYDEVAALRHLLVLLDLVLVNQPHAPVLRTGGVQLPAGLLEHPVLDRVRDVPPNDVQLVPLAQLRLDLPLGTLDAGGDVHLVAHWQVSSER